MKRLRISGLVRLMNQVRDDLSTGISPGEEENFRRLVQGGVRQVEEICREHKIKPGKLPAPTYRAYLYLKELDLTHIPVEKHIKQPSPAPTRVNNLIGTCRAIQNEMWEITTSHKNTAIHGQTEQRAVTMQNRIHALAESVDAALENAGVSVESLSKQSQRAYSWVCLLSEETHLKEHFATLQAIQDEILQKKNQTKSIKRRLDQPVHVELFNLGAVYIVKQGKEGLRIQAHEGFVGAPEEVIKALVLITLVGKRASDRNGKPSLSIIKSYPDSSAYRRIASKLEIKNTPVQQRFQGQFFNLEDIYNHINQTYFNGNMPKPNLVWNKTLTHRKFGHYHAASDTVMISISLDRPSTPHFVIEFVMYHELLHKQIGTTNNNGRHYAHTRSFREAEARFPKHKQAEAALNELGTKLIKGKS